MEYDELLKILIGNIGPSEVELDGKENLLKILSQSGSDTDEAKITRTPKGDYGAELAAGAYTCHLQCFAGEIAEKKESRDMFLDLVRKLENGTQEEKLVDYKIMKDDNSNDIGGWYITKR